MKTYKYFLPVMLISILIASCSGENKETSADTTEPEIIQPQGTDQVSTEQQPSAGDQIQPAEMAPDQAPPQPIQVNPSQVNPQMQQQVQPAGKAMAGMNPEHGQPGHRCDIPVGAPLDSPPGNNTTAPTTTIQPQTAPATVGTNPSIMNAPTPVTATPSTTPSSGKLNPPHGEPGHDCAVAVGAPLPAK